MEPIEVVIKPGAGDQVLSAADDRVGNGIRILLPGYVFTEGKKYLAHEL